MKAEEIANKEFPVVMRGYVREEVQTFLVSVAAQMAERDARIAKLESELASVRKAKPTVPERSVLLRTLGEEAASILACADASAERLQAQARINAAKVHADLRSIGSSLVDVHQLLGELVSLVQGLTDGADVEGEDTEVNVPGSSPPELRTVLGEVLGLDGEGEEIDLPEESEVPGANPAAG